MTKLLALKLDLIVEEFMLRTHGNVLAHGHAEAPRHETRDAGQDDGMGVTGRRTGDAHDQAHVGHEAVGCAKHGRAQDARTARLVGTLRGREHGPQSGPNGAHHGSRRWGLRHRDSVTRRMSTCALTIG